MKSIFITSAVRTGIGTFRKSLKDINAIELGAYSISKSNLKKNDIDEIIMGQVLTGAMGQNPARQAAIKSGIPKEKPAYTVNQVCGSGMRSIVSGLQSIKSNDSKIIVAGGQENMSLAPHAVHLKDGEKIRDADLVNMMIKDGLWDAFNGYHMGITAENIAEKFQISRDEQDKFALKSQEKSLKAKNEKKFKNEIVNLKIKSKKKEINFNEDEHPRYDVNLENLSKLKPIFKNNGTVTAGNASGINDGAAAVILMSEDEAKRRDLETLVSIKSWACCGVDPALMGTGPIPASKKALELAGWAIKDVDLFEINEAFAAQSIAVLKTLSIPDEKVNVNGGAISLGHPIGASGARILVTLIHEMIKRDVKKGLATLCIGGGMGITLCIER